MRIFAIFRPRPGNRPPCGLGFCPENGLGGGAGKGFDQGG